MPLGMLTSCVGGSKLKVSPLTLYEGLPEEEADRGVVEREARVETISTPSLLFLEFTTERRLPWRRRSHSR